LDIGLIMEVFDYGGVWIWSCKVMSLMKQSRDSRDLQPLSDQSDYNRNGSEANPKSMPWPDLSAAFNPQAPYDTRCKSSPPIQSLGRSFPPSWFLLCFSQGVQAQRHGGAARSGIR